MRGGDKFTSGWMFTKKKLHPQFSQLGTNVKLHAPCLAAESQPDPVAWLPHKLEIHELAEQHPSKQVTVNCSRLRIDRGDRVFNNYKLEEIMQINGFSPTKVENILLGVQNL